MKMFHRGRHRSRRGCRDHIARISRHERELEAMEKIMSWLSDDRDEAMREAGRLRSQLEDLRQRPVPINPPALTDCTAMLSAATEITPVPSVAAVVGMYPVMGPVQQLYGGRS